jgi:fatty acid desaturase
MDYCKYKNSLGELNKGTHKLRDPIFNTALNDVVMTVAGAFVISYITNYQFVLVLVILFIMGILLHRMFCVRTTIDKFLFPRSI